MTRPLHIQTISLSRDQLLSGADWFEPLGAKAKSHVRDDLIERTIGVGDALGHQGETQHHWFGVMEGLLKWSVNAIDGRTVTLGGQSVGSWFGEGTLLRSQPRQADIIALRDSRVAMLPRATFDWLRRTEPSFNEFLLRQINERLHWFMGSMAAHRLLDAEHLVIRALWGLVHPLLNPLGLHHLLISQEEVANLAMVSRQRCNMALLTLKREGLIELGYGAISIRDIDALAARMR
ncbi:Crp/Fnr family transcriptional regulator [Pusillimonas sp.]|uniref:Crp/Fnr family transcriptional regulator n=1 Tax=Pusillimonas sp. TaxID=3040095 RepID=UPI0037C54A1D